MKRYAILIACTLFASHFLYAESGVLVELECVRVASIGDAGPMYWDGEFRVLRQFSGEKNIVGAEFSARINGYERSSSSMPLYHWWKDNDRGLWLLEVGDSISIDYESSSYYQMMGVPIPIPEAPIHPLTLRGRSYQDYLYWAEHFSEIDDFEDSDEYIDYIELVSPPRNTLLRDFLLGRIYSIESRNKIGPKNERAIPYLSEMEGVRQRWESRQEKRSTKMQDYDVGVEEGRNNSLNDQEVMDNSATSDIEENGKTRGRNINFSVAGLLLGVFALCFLVWWNRRVKK